MSKNEATQLNPMEALLGPTLLTNAKGETKPTKTLLKDKDLVALYFSASWCPPCKTFSPILIDFYKNCGKQGKLEIVYVSSDRNIPDFEAYYGKMPWLSIPNGQGSAEIKNGLAQQLKISGIPTLVILDAKTGEFISANGREDVTNVQGSPEKGLNVIALWNSKERVPLSEASAAQGPGGLMGILFFIGKNPMYIFGILYIVKWIMRKLQELGDDDPVPAIQQDEIIPDENPDSEF